MFFQLLRSSNVPMFTKFHINIPCTPWKINMEPTNHPFRRENDDLSNLHEDMFQPLIFRGVGELKNDDNPLVFCDV